MSRRGALDRANEWREEIVARGAPVSIELVPGRPGTPHDRWWDDRFIGTLGHHIVSRRSHGKTPFLALCKRGRVDLPGPICNGYGGFDYVARLLCMGWANHPGAGGPLTLPGGTIPRDSGRPYLAGWEFEGGLADEDWDTDGGAMHEFMAVCLAGTLAWLERDDRSHAEHSTWTPRKIDRRNYSRARGRALIRPHLTEEKNMAILLRKGSRGSKVAKVQRYLVTLGYDLGKFGPDKDGVDGVFGSKMRQAVIKYQGDVWILGAVPDGVVEDFTLSNLVADVRLHHHQGAGHS